MRKRKSKGQKKIEIRPIGVTRLFSFIGILGTVVFVFFWKGCAGSVSSSVNETEITPAVSAFNGERAFDFLVKQVEFGPRVPGTEESVKTQNFIAQKLQEAGAKVLRQKFSVTYRGKTYQMANVIGIVKGKSERKVLLCAHYDTRPVADQDPNPENRNKPIPGANDGASGVAVLLEIAQVLKTHQPPRTVVF
ncbi:MAG: M28 family peptidase, partial [Armatimonadetes bacterium]|nr:M28 family peptidase [Armatimonadota bacterium]